MTLKLNLEEKKLKINMQQAEKEILTKNTKAKIMNELESEFLIKCEQNKKFEKKIKKLEEIINLKQKEEEEEKKKEIEIQKNEEEKKLKQKRALRFYLRRRKENEDEKEKWIRIINNEISE